ncbi:MAG TPA: hypothetical protein VJA87_03740 [Candidatus Paceibacterota bacterium]
MEIIDYYKNRTEWLEQHMEEKNQLMCSVACRLIIFAERNLNREYGTKLARECVEELTGMSYKEFLSEYGQILDLYDNDDL